MDCSPKALIDLATCTDPCGPSGLVRAAQIASACAWTNAGGGPPCTLPTAPVDLGATFGYNQVTLTWPAGVGATGYNIKRALVTGGPYTVIGTSAASPYVDLTAVNGTAYYYVVSSTNACGESAGNSLESHATPGFLQDRWYFSNTIPSPGTSFAIGFEGAGSRIVDWGDGNTTTTSGNVVDTHVYAAAGNYTYSVRQSVGVTTRLYHNALAGSTLLTGILTPPNGMTGLTNLYSSFFGCTGLTGSIPSLSTLTGVTTLAYAFFGCTGLTGPIPSLSALTGLTSLYSVFYNCAGLTGSIPSLNTLTGMTDMTGAFANCTGITGNIPDLSALTALTSLSFTFSSCSSLTGNIPILSTLTALTDISYAFFGCSGLTANTRTVAQIFGSASFPNLITATRCFYTSVPYLLGNAADFISLTKNAGFTVGVAPTDGSYQMFTNQTTLTDYAATPAAWK